MNSRAIGAVARTAKLSKVGVLYYFPSKEGLIEGMVANLVRDFQADLDRELEKDADTPGAFTRAFLRASLENFEPLSI
jgi:AcrR family transcriptional regulator